MKYPFLLSILLSAFSFGQDWNIIGNSGTNPTMNYIGTNDNQPLIIKSNNNEGIRILQNGDVRIGADTDIFSTAVSFRIFRNILPTIELANPFGRLQIIKSSCNNCGAKEAIAGDTVIKNLGQSHNMIFYMPNDNNDGKSYIGFGDDTNSIWVKIFNNKRATFNGKISAQEIEVKTNVWADFVFNKNYDLPKLEDIETYITNHGKLPDIPSEEEVLKNGFNISNMTAKLLQKIEELTLYSIEQNKKINQLEEKLNKISEKIEN